MPSHAGCGLVAMSLRKMSKRVPTMTNFLEVGSMREELAEILASAAEIHRLLALSASERLAIEQSRVRQGDLTTVSQDLQAAAVAIVSRCEEMLTFLDRFESEPIIYTGPGSTQEVLTKLQRLSAIARDLGEEL